MRDSWIFCKSPPFNCSKTPKYGSWSHPLTQSVFWDIQILWKQVTLLQSLEDTLLKKWFQHRCFCLNFAEISKNTFFVEHLWTNSQENTCVRSLLFNNVAGLRPATLLKKRLWQRCFPVNFPKFLRMLILIEQLRWLLLYFTIVTILFIKTSWITTFLEAATWGVLWKRCS